jgi:hypothetical protein
MAAIFAFKCTCCGEVHEGSPSVAFKAPDQYACLTDEQKAQMGSIDPDFCTITHESGVDCFIRAILEVPIHGVEEPFLWGVWVSLSQNNFDRYRATFSDPVPGDGCFGWLCNVPSDYPTQSSRGADVYFQQGGHRPLVVLHSREPETDTFVLDQMNGISIARAQQIAERSLHPPPEGSDEEST